MPNKDYTGGQHEVDLVGLDPMPVYLQMMPILAELAGLPVPEAVLGSAEDIPFDDDEFDVVLCYSSHQYMDLSKAIAEMDRVVNDTGEAIIVGGRPFGPQISAFPATPSNISRPSGNQSTACESAEDSIAVNCPVAISVM